MSGPLERVSVDLLDCVNGFKGYRYILSALDHYSRYVKLYPLRTKGTDEVSEAFERYVSDFGAPASLLCDNGGEFVAATFKELCRRHKIRTGYTTPYHPQGNSLTERMHRTVKSILGALCRGHPLRWPKLLQDIQVVMNQAVHTTTGQQPFFAFFNRYAPRRVGATLPEVLGTSEGLTIAHELLKNTHLNMSRKFRATAKQHRRNDMVNVGALVSVKAERLRHSGQRTR